jgi:pimeloyl-ACP methyl ester carboxylesterase
VERSSFRFVEPLLTDRFTLYAVDRRGRGESGDSTNGYAIEQEFADIAAVVDSLAEPADLFGHSYGATVALGAARLARNVRRLILYEPAPGVPVVDPDALEQLRASPTWGLRVTTVHTIPRELRAEESYRPDAAAFASLAVPALLLLGSESPQWAKKGTEVVQSALPDNRVAVLQSEGHTALMTAPELVADEVARFLGE